ncbi:MAG TPA: site-specific integrase [Terriglobales bacterium]|jgi:integrase
MNQAHGIVESKTRGTWHLKYSGADGAIHRKQIGNVFNLPTREAAEKAAEPLIRALCKASSTGAPLVADLVRQFRDERMSQRHSTKLACDSRLNNHVIPRWGHMEITAVKARDTELWLKSLELSPKTRVHLRGLLHQLWDYAMFRGDVPVERNPMELVTIKGATKRLRQPRSLTVDEFQKFAAQLSDLERTIALVCVCFGLRISECLGLKWHDVDWLGAKLRVERGIVRQKVDDVKTVYSSRTMAIDTEMLAVFKSWRQQTQFAADSDWIFASPTQLGRLPVSYPHVWLSFQDGARSAGIGKLGTHTMRHTYRSWLDAAGTAIAVQQKLMRHSDIRTTMNIYGDVVTDEMSQAHSKVVRMALAKQ